MKILDWRPQGEKWLTKMWGGAASRAGINPGAGGRLWAGIHGRFGAQRIEARPVPADSPFILSVGNLALGGTGKTPVVIALAQDLAGAGRRGCVLTRGFRSPLAGPLVVQANNVLAGDEARLLAHCVGEQEWTVVQARDRAAGLKYLLSELSPMPDVVVLEDGHQTAGIGRHLDILILDHWVIRDTNEGPEVVPATGHVFPFGPWREAATGAERAAVWLLETTDDVPDRGVGGSRVVTFQRKFTCRPVNHEANREYRRPALVSGIARPEKFEIGAREILTADPVLAVRLADHEPYSPRLVQRVQQAMKASDCDGLVTTAKDWIKLAPFWPDDLPAQVIDLQIVWGSGTTLPELVGERL